MKPTGKARHQAVICIRLPRATGDIAHYRAGAESMVALGGPGGVIAEMGQLMLPQLDMTAETRRERRDAAIVKLRQEYHPGETLSGAAAKIASKLNAYTSSQWYRDRGPDDRGVEKARLSYRGTENELLFRIMCETPTGHPIKGRQIRTVLAAAIRQSAMGCDCQPFRPKMEK